MSTSEPATATAVDLDRAALVVTANQVEALAALLTHGKHKGTTLPDCDPPARVALVAADTLQPEFETWSDGAWKAGEIPRPDVVLPPGHTLGVVADDGRSWEIVRAGICWPQFRTSEGAHHG